MGKATVGSKHGELPRAGLHEGESRVEHGVSITPARLPCQQKGLNPSSDRRFSVHCLLFQCTMVMGRRGNCYSAERIKEG